VSQQHDDTAPVEHDPTGMRALLASLPDPGPMPDDLVARISAALAVEAQRGHGIDRIWGVDDEPDAASSPVGDADTTPADAVAPVVPLRRRLGLRHLAVAAAVLGVLGVGGFLVKSLPGDVMAAFGTTAGSSDSSAVAPEAAAAPDARALVAPPAGSGEVVVVMSGVDHAAARLDVTARELDDGTLDPISDLTAEAPAIGPIATPIGARACATALGIPADAGILVDVSEVDGVSAAVLVVHSDSGRTAWAVDRSCTTGNTGLIRGPVPLR
jgi:hypothetical protein